MFELSSRLIGIYKVANQTRSVAIGKPQLPTPVSTGSPLTRRLLVTDNSDLHQLAITAAA